MEKDCGASLVPSSARSCTDIFFLLLYFLAWVGMILIISIAGARGANVNKIIHGVDYDGNICGVSKGFGDRPYAAFVAMPTAAHQASSNDCDGCYQIHTCVASCDQTTTFPEIGDWYVSEPLLYYCIPVPTSAGGTRDFSYAADFQTATELASRAFSDLFIAWPVILICGFVALIFAFAYCWLAERWAGSLVVFAILLVAAGGFLCSYAFLKKAQEAADTAAADRARAMRGLGITMVVITFIFLCIMLFLRDRIRIAVEVVKEASRAVMDMPSLIFFPIFPLLVAMGYFAFFIATVIYVASVWVTNTPPFPAYIQNNNANGAYTQINASQSAQTGQGAVPVGSYYHYKWDQSLKNSVAYAFFHLLWTIQFLEYFAFMVVAGSIAQWYFTPRDQAKNKMLSSKPVMDSVYRAFRFHLGTIAFGSLIIATIQFIRAVVKYIEEKTAPKHGPPNFLQKAIFCLIRCCLYCVQCCMDKISRNAFVWTAIWGDPFAEAACSSFALIWANLGRVAAVSLVGEYIIFVGKMLVAIITTGIGGIAVYKAYGKTSNSLTLPMVVIFVLAYTVATLFMITLSTTIDAVFLCFLVDEKSNKARGQMYASEELQAVIHAHSAHSEKIAEQERAARKRMTEGQQLGLAATDGVVAGER